VFALIALGRSLAGTAEKMTAETGRPWMPTTVARIVKRSEYKRAGEWRVVSPKVWSDAQAALASRRKVAA
jgi:hypothetical protein